MCKVPKPFMVVNRILQKANFMRLTISETRMVTENSVEEMRL